MGCSGILRINNCFQNYVSIFWSFSETVQNDGWDICVTLWIFVWRVVVFREPPKMKVNALHSYLLTNFGNYSTSSVIGLKFYQRLCLIILAFCKVDALSCRLDFWASLQSPSMIITITFFRHSLSTLCPFTTRYSRCCGARAYTYIHTYIYDIKAH